MKPSPTGSTQRDPVRDHILGFSQHALPMHHDLDEGVVEHDQHDEDENESGDSTEEAGSVEDDSFPNAPQS